MTNNNKKVLFFAPEIPALSATFVYNELIAIKALGHSVSVASVHKPTHRAEQKIVDAVGDVFYLYDRANFKVLTDVVKIILKKPFGVIATFFTLLLDVVRLGVVNRIAIGQFYRFYRSLSLALYLSNMKVEHIHIHFAHVPTDIGMYAAKIINIPFSVMAHANDIFERGWLLKEKIERSAFFATISEFNIAYLKQFSKSSNKLKVIHCGVDKAKFSSVSSRQKGDSIRFGMLGRLVEKKGTRYLIEAFKEIKGVNANAKLEIVGDGPLQESLLQLCQNLDLQDSVEFLGKMPHDKVSNWLKEIDCFVLPCVKDSNGDMDGIPVSLMEAMMMKIPVISTKISGIPELIINHETGWLAEPGSNQDLIDALTDFINSSDKEIDEIVEKAREHVLVNFEQSVNAKKLSALIQCKDN